MKLLSRAECGERLGTIFPPDVVENPRAVSGPLAAAAVYVCIYLGALEGRRSTCATKSCSANSG